MLFTEILKKEKTFQHIMQQSSHSAEPVSHSHLCVNRRWSKRRPMTSLQEWAVCGGEQTYSDAHLPAVAVEGLTMGCKEGPPSFFTHTCPPLESLNSYIFFFFSSLFLDLCRVPTGNQWNRKCQMWMGWFFASGSLAEIIWNKCSCTKCYEKVVRLFDTDFNGCATFWWKLGSEELEMSLALPNLPPSHDRPLCCLWISSLWSWYQWGLKYYLLKWRYPFTGSSKPY